MQGVITSYVSAIMQNVQTQMTAGLQSAMGQLSSSMANAMGIDTDAFANAFQMNMTAEEFGQLMMSYLTADQDSYENNLTLFGYADLESPDSVSIYPIDFESKTKVIAILDNYNERMEAEGNDDKVISFTDMVGTLMSSVTDIINMVSAVLVAFVTISLVVSSIMIGIITYISVLERKKEIGILRAVGASKKDIRRVFNAETLIIGFVAGMIGILSTILICIPANMIIYANFAVADVAALPWESAVILVLISMFLSFIAGLIPSSSASRKDPVEALRSE
jgi:ABC-type antimicrobial peptide transport system permease subunit